jgi:hypothetical protein
VYSMQDQLAQIRPRDNIYYSISHTSLVLDPDYTHLLPIDPIAQLHLAIIEPRADKFQRRKRLGVGDKSTEEVHAAGTTL